MTPQLLPIADSAHTRRAAWALLRPYRRLAVVAGLALALATVVGLAGVDLLGRIVDDVRAGGTDLARPAVLLALAATVHGIGTAIGAARIAEVGERMLADLRERFVERALHLPLDRIEAAGAGDLTARVTRDVTAVAEAVRYALPTLVRSALSIGLTLVALALLDWRFLVAALVAMPLQAGTVRWYARTAGPVYADSRVAVAAQQQQLLDSYAGADTVLAFGLARRHTDLIAARSAAAVDLSLRGVGLLSRFFSRLNLAEFVALGGVLTVGYLLVGAGSVTLGTATAAALYLHNLFNPINAALGLADEVQVARAGLSRLVGIADLPAPSTGPAATSPATWPEATSPATATPPSAATAAGADPVPPAIVVSGVRHAYRPGEDVLHGVDLEVSAGERLALVGASGAGKTTLASLVAGTHRPHGGRIALGGHDVAELAPAELRRRVVLVTQDVHVFAGALADDLRLARPGATDAELWAALGRVGAIDWVRTLPDGLATVVGEGGHRLTEEQAQHLALARLVLADPPVVILDEATADAGSAGARALEAAANRALSGRTAIVVAHRLTQAAEADRVVVMADGRIVESGTHDALVAAEGPYAALWSAWSAHR
ncbi:ATP-binding cassette subfamily C protein [Krasilnikovia cinnamomea]|uniref:ATP-binding cassette subfamily C protein n=1 Tax=Krasilnikovia cinnamomea TaxID=349313 RepID=A0A4V2G7U9_9ACTN|nr:ABC transporter ATP-binding protein [Krasilnikovia cinnamomea]RZU54016.1 ATP-binding cassette subfamily C protein [Krasilnikovia cinnamomea]